MEIKESEELTKKNSIGSSAKKGLTKEDAVTLAKAMTYLSCAKNIQLMEGTMDVWEDCLGEDLDKRVFTLEEFIEAIKVGVRRSLYNRIDYSDIYKEAIRISYESFNSGKKSVEQSSSGAREAFNEYKQLFPKNL